MKLGNGDPPPEFMGSATGGDHHALHEALAELAERIKPVKKDVVRVADEIRLHPLKDIVGHFKRHSGSAEQDELKKRGSRKSVVRIFTGEMDDQKHLIFQQLANTLNRDLYRIDLRSFVGKFIGETEKNLGKIFDAAEHLDAVLFFDESDLLFGKRTDVKDSHDRYAVMKKNVLLKKMEGFSGLSILATDMNHHVEGSPEKSTRFMVHFPIPDPE